MTHAPPPDAPRRARIPGPRHSPPPRRRPRASSWRRRLWGAAALCTLTALVTQAVRHPASPPALALLGGVLFCSAYAVRTYRRHGRDAE
ncbi:hypothetical protein [Streptomyces sp. V3I7]|uniref:hypothetical protein n=1 Tax=Streptomyces sp. V3I7 TaxID=3042278 RepID=UPI0027813D57|nr:hypothetical protein [Streptomyces sp. V3I7]MDQ0991011.1 hypothetical protein [Streptomyces sp. V3I7]